MTNGPIEQHRETLRELADSDLPAAEVAEALLLLEKGAAPQR